MHRSFFPWLGLVFLRIAFALPSLFVTDAIEYRWLICLYMTSTLILFLALLFYELNCGEAGIERPWWGVKLELLFALSGFIMSTGALFGVFPVAWIGMVLLLSVVWGTDAAFREKPFAEKVVVDFSVF